MGDSMVEDRRLAYLEAMEIDVWLPRRTPPEPGAADMPRPKIAPRIAPEIACGDGEGDLLCIAGSEADAGQKLAADISRAMRSMPVWAWRTETDGAEDDARTVEAVVKDRLITRVLVFGNDLSDALFGSSAPTVIGAARLFVVPGLQRLGHDRDAKRILWKLMVDQGIARKTSRQ